MPGLSHIVTLERTEFANIIMDSRLHASYVELLQTCAVFDVVQEAQCGLVIVDITIRRIRKALAIEYFICAASIRILSVLFAWRDSE